MAVEELLEFGEAEFLLGNCPDCKRRVLTYPADASDGGGSRCVHCDSSVTDELREANGDDLPDAGYGLLELQGCGNPDCGGGRCSREQA